jgi:hypothetical protein
MKILLLVIVMSGVALACCFGEAAPTFTISTKERLGFTKDSNFYALRTKADDFHRRFGAAEKAEKDDSNDGYLAHTVTDYYVKDGLMVTAKNDETIIGFIFYLVPSPILKPAQVATDRGIAAGVSERDIIKQYGEPYRKKEYKDDVSDRRELYYKYGESVLSFRFNHGTLQAISLNAEYLPYLAK